MDSAVQWWGSDTLPSRVRGETCRTSTASRSCRHSAETAMQACTVLVVLMGTVKAREGRNLSLLADLLMRMQCAPLQCQASAVTAQICCARQLALHCCGGGPGQHHRPAPRPALPVLPFTLGIALGLAPALPTLHHHTQETKPGFSLSL